MTELEEILLLELEEPVKLKDGRIAVHEDGTPMTKQEAIATNLIAKAMNGDIPAIQYIENIKRMKELKADRKRKK